jgi:hypothetical protein
MAFCMKKEMTHTFDFGYTALADPEAGLVKAHVYDNDDDDMVTVSFMVLEDGLAQPTVFLTGAACYRFTCLGTDLLVGFEEGRLGDFVLRDLSEVFDLLVPGADVRLFSDLDFLTLRGQAMAAAVGQSVPLCHCLPAGVAVDIARCALPAWTSYHHDAVACEAHVRNIMQTARGNRNHIDTMCREMGIIAR